MAKKKKVKDPAAVSLGRRGGKARAKSLTPEELSELGKNAIEARWRKYREAQTANEMKTPKPGNQRQKKKAK